MHEVALRFGHLQPTAVRGCVMTCALLQDPARLCRRERLVEARAVMGVQMVLHQTHALGLGAMHVHQLPDACSIVSARTACRPLDMTPPPPWFAQHPLVADPFPLLCIIDPGCPTLARPLGRSHLA